MNETQIIKKIAKFLFLTNTEIKETVDFMSDEFAKELKKGERIYIRNFGSLQKVRRKERKIRNVEDGKMMTVPEHWTVEFRPAPALKKKINRRP